MPNYGQRSVTLTVGDSNEHQLLSSNPGRVTLIVSSSTTPTSNVALSVSQTDNDRYLLLGTPFNVVLAYRDYGPIMRQALWFKVGVFPCTINATEIFIIPGS